jgi:hypothetical protein
MSTPFESAKLILELYELRREPAMRAARTWFTREFSPTTFPELVAIVAGEHNAQFRMVIGYWDMACSLVVHGAIDQQMFVDANPEMFAAFLKIEPFIDDLRVTNGMPLLVKHWETVMRTTPDLEQRLAAVRTRFGKRTGVESSIPR